MTQETVKGTIETAYGNALQTPVAYEGVVDLYSNVEEVKAANDWPSNDEIVKIVNRNRIANARQKFMTAALDAAGIKKPGLDDPQEAFKQMVKILTATGKDESTAKGIANATLGTSF